MGDVSRFPSSFPGEAGRAFLTSSPLAWVGGAHPPYYHGSVNRIATGLDQLLQEPSLVRGRRWAMVSNHAAVTSGLEPGRLALSTACGLPVRLLAPEHS